MQCPLEVFGEHLEYVPKSFTELDARDLNLLNSQVEELPSNLSELLLSQTSVSLLSILPKTLRRLHLMPKTGLSLLTKGVYEGTEMLEVLECCLHHLESITCFNIFKRLKFLQLRVEEQHLSNEESIFSGFHQSSVDTLEELQLTMGAGATPPWPKWLLELEKFQNIKKLTCQTRMLMSEDEDRASVLPEHFKHLPPHLEELDVPPIPTPILFARTSNDDWENLVSSPDFLDCFHHFPSSLTRLSIGGQFTDRLTLATRPLKLSDACFTHLPPNLTYLNLTTVIGLTNRIWEILPPDIGDLYFHNEVSELPSYQQKRKEYLQANQNLKFPT
jgi:hypothetical protein